QAGRSLTDSPRSGPGRLCRRPDRRDRLPHHIVSRIYTSGAAMNEAIRDLEAQAMTPEQLDPGLAALSLIAGYYRIAADPAQLRHQLALTGRLVGPEELVRAANLLQLKSRVIRGVSAKRIGTVPYPAILELQDGGFAVLAVAAEKGKIRLV